LGSRRRRIREEISDEGATRRPKTRTRRAASAIGIKTFDKLLKLPRHWVLTAVVIFSVVGAYALQNSMFDVYVMALFGVIGFGLELLAIPLAPLILGLILGPMVEKNLRTGLIKTEGDWMPFLTRPFCAVMASMLVLMLVGPLVLRFFKKQKSS